MQMKFGISKSGIVRTDSPPAPSDGPHHGNPALLAQFMASSFVTAGDGHGGTPIADAPASQPPLLAQPHA